MSTCLLSFHFRHVIVPSYLISVCHGLRTAYWSSFGMHFLFNLSFRTCLFTPGVIRRKKNDQIPHSIGSWRPEFRSGMLMQGTILRKSLLSISISYTNNGLRWRSVHRFLADCCSHVWTVRLLASNDQRLQGEARDQKNAIMFRITVFEYVNSIRMYWYPKKKWAIATQKPTVRYKDGLHLKICTVSTTTLLESCCWRSYTNCGGLLCKYLFICPYHMERTVINFHFLQHLETPQLPVFVSSTFPFLATFGDPSIASFHVLCYI